MKKIFDEIFDTTKYTKALQEMRQIAKKYSKYAREFKQELDLQKKDYEQYIKIKASLKVYDDKINEITADIEKSQQAQEAILEEIKELEQAETEVLD